LDTINTISKTGPCPILFLGEEPKIIGDKMIRKYFRWNV